MTERRARFFHEDDYCQQEFLSLACWDHCASQVQEIDSFSEAHRTEFGWTAMYVRPPAPTPLAELGISVSDIAAVVASVLPAFHSVSTGYSSHVEDCPNVSAFGWEHGITLFAEADAAARVAAMWLAPWGLAPSELQSVVGVLTTLPRAHDLLFVDWAWSRLFKAADREAWVAYFGEHHRHLGERA